MAITAAVAALSMIAFGTSNLQREFAFASQADQSSGADPAALPISVERIRDALQRPELWIPPLPVPSATFRSGVEDTLPFESVLDGMRRELALWSGANSIIHPPVSGLPSSRLGGGVDVLPLLSALANKWQAAKRERARDRISRELAAFCAVTDCSILEGEASPAEGILQTPSR